MKQETRQAKYVCSSCGHRDYEHRRRICPACGHCGSVTLNMKIF